MPATNITRQLLTWNPQGKTRPNTPAERL